MLDLATGVILAVPLIEMPAHPCVSFSSVPPAGLVRHGCLLTRWCLHTGVARGIPVNIWLYNTGSRLGPPFISR